MSKGGMRQYRYDIPDVPVRFTEEGEKGIG